MLTLKTHPKNELFPQLKRSNINPDNDGELGKMYELN